MGIDITTMALEVIKQERENSQGLIRRFTRGMQQSGILARARKLQFKKRVKSKGMRKKAALRKVELKKVFEKKKKLMKEEKRRR